MQVLADEALVKLCLEGDPTAFAEIVTRYQKQIFSLAYRLTNQVEDAQDLAQEAFLKIYQVLDKYDTSRPFFPWMYKVAVNVCYTALRKKPQEEVPLDKIIDFAPTIPQAATQPEDYAETREVQRVVHQALADLPEKYKVPLALRYLEDMTYRQIANTMDLPLTTIETRLFRGKTLLQKRLKALERGGKT